MGLETRIQRERQRLERVLAFSLEAARALRQELDGLHATGQAPWDDALAARVQARMATVQAEVARGHRFLAEAPTAATPETLRTLEAYDLKPLSDATRGLQGLGIELRDRVPAREAAARPAPPPPARTPTTRLGAPTVRPDQVAIRGVVPRPAVRELPAGAWATGKLDHWGGGGQAPARKPVAAPPAGHAFGDRSSVGGIKAFEAARRLSGEVLGYVGPRLALVQAAVHATGLPGPRHPWPQVLAAFEPPSKLAEPIHPPLRPWLPPLARLFYGEIPVAREALMALQQWTQARQLHQEAERVAETLARVPPQAQVQVLAGFNTGRLRGAAYALSHLHVRFKDTQHLNVLFPAPARG